MKTLYYTTITSPIGALALVASTKGLVAVHMETHPLPTTHDWIADEEPFRDVNEQLNGYFSGRLQEFDLPLDLSGTPFQLRVWEALREIPFGETIHYGEQARRIGNPAASRAVGLANGRNPVSIIVPCHRVIGKNGALTGFGGGLERKKYLLDLERKVRFPDQRSAEQGRFFAIEH